MNPVLIDSDILVEISRGRDQALLERWDELSCGDLALFCSPVTIAEIWHVARPHEHPILTGLFAAMTCVPIDEKIGRRAGDYLRQYTKNYAVELGDAIIAATASVHKLSLWARNRKHYPMKDVTFY